MLTWIQTAPPRTCSHGGPRRYFFNALNPGDVLAVALNGQAPARAWNSVANAARFYRDTKHPGFDWVIFRSPGFLHVERLPDGLRGEARRRYLDTRTLDRATDIGRTRALTPYEVGKVIRAADRQRAQVAA